MEISDEAYNNSSWKTSIIVDKNDPIFSTEPIFDVRAAAFESMQKQEFENHRRFNEIYLKISRRYDNQDAAHGYYGTYPQSGWREWTPKQLKRMRKQTNKWRKKILGE